MNGTWHTSATLCTLTLAPTGKQLRKNETELDQTFMTSWFFLVHDRFYPEVVPLGESVIFQIT